MALHPCPHCKRHVHHHESRCPFCGETLPIMSSDSPYVARMSRAAMMLGAAVALGAAQGCERSTRNQLPISNPPSPQPNIHDPNAVAQVYGAPPIEVRDSSVAQQEQQPSQPDAAAIDEGIDLPIPIDGDAAIGSDRGDFVGYSMAPGLRYGAPAWIEDHA
jgi:hypothetical protein